VITIRRVAGFVCIVLLSACGGGSSSGGGGGGSVTVPPPVTLNLSDQSVQRSDAQSGLAGVEAYQEYEGGGSISTLTAARAMRTMLAKVSPKSFADGARPRPLLCNAGDGVNETIVNNGNGSLTITIEDYYDDACTQPEAEVVWTATQSGSTVSGPASFTEYSASGTVTGTASAQITFLFNNSSLQEETGFSFLLTDVVENGEDLGEIGVACTLTVTGSCSSAGVAAAANASSIDSEEGASVTLSVSSTLSMNVAQYQGAENSLTVSQGTFPAWTISPSSALLSSVSISGSATANGFALTLTDSTYGGTLAITGTASGVTGTLTNTATGATVASFTVNAQGNGTLTYSNGTQVSIVDYIVQG